MHQLAVLVIFSKNTLRLVAVKLNQRIGLVSIGFHQMNIYRHLLQKLCDLEFQLWIVRFTDLQQQMQY